MKRSSLLTTALAITTACAAVLFAWTLVHALLYAPEVEGVAHAVVVATSSEPVRLQIPALDIDTKVQQVGINKKGEMAIPSNFTDVGWYKYGTVPGHLGSAVIDGHVDNALSLPGVFKHLNEMKVGDDVYVVDQDGTRLHFVVTDIQTYPYKNAPAEKIFNRTDKARLNLITCKGDWLAASKTYDERLVVYTELAPD